MRRHCRDCRAVDTASQMQSQSPLLALLAVKRGITTAVMLRQVGASHKWLLHKHIQMTVIKKQTLDLPQALTDMHRTGCSIQETWMRKRLNKRAVLLFAVSAMQPHAQASLQRFLTRLNSPSRAQTQHQWQVQPLMYTPSLSSPACLYNQQQHQSPELQQQQGASACVSVPVLGVDSSLSDRRQAPASRWCVPQ